MGSAVSSAEAPCLEDFEIIRFLGKGAFGDVQLVRYRVDGKLYAMKMMEKETVVLQDMIEHTRLERDIMLTCEHPFIVKLHTTIHTATTLYLIMDYIPGESLWTRLCEHPDTCFPEDQARFFVAEILLGVEELHKHSIVYRDLKPENILIHSDGHVKLTDFGLSHKLHNIKDRLYSFSGTAIYIGRPSIWRYWSY